MLASITLIIASTILKTFYFFYGGIIMTVYDELVARGLIAQVTDEEEIKELINNGKATFYIGFEIAQLEFHHVH